MERLSKTLKSDNKDIKPEDINTICKLSENKQIPELIKHIINKNLQNNFIKIINENIIKLESNIHNYCINETTNLIKPITVIEKINHNLNKCNVNTITRQN